jgi:hypothetical protein
VVVAFAVDFYHDGYGFSFAFHAFMFRVRGLRSHRPSHMIVPVSV